MAFDLWRHAKRWLPLAMRGYRGETLDEMCVVWLDSVDWAYGRGNKPYFVTKVAYEIESATWKIFIFSRERRREIFHCFPFAIVQLFLIILIIYLSNTVLLTRNVCLAFVVRENCANCNIDMNLLAHRQDSVLIIWLNNSFGIFLNSYLYHGI